jgi:hypothetical protein
MLSKTLLIIVTATAALGASQVQVRPPQPPRDPGRVEQQQAAPVGTGTISGIVTMGGSGQPARKVRVNLSGQPSAQSGGRGMAGRSTTTDDQGRFSFTALPAGRYSLSATKPGYLSMTYGARRPGTQGTQIQLGDGQKFQAQLQIPKGSVLTGMVLDETGEATPGTNVRAMRFVMQGGRRTLQQSGSGSTDDRGIYRIYNLQPGDYVVCANPRNTMMGEYERTVAEMQGLQQALASLAESRVGAEQLAQMRERLSQLQSAPQQQDDVPAGYAAVCYPGTIVTSQASPIALGVGEERSGIDFQLQLVAMARVEGTVVNSTGQQVQNIQVTLQDATTIGNSLNNMNSARADADGRFRFSAVAPGQYRVTARAQVGGPGGRGGRGMVPMEVSPTGRGGPPPQRVEPTIVWASADISVDGRHLSNVMLALQPGLSITGQLTFEGAIPPPTDLTRLRVSVNSADPGPMSMSGNGRVEANGRFTIPSVAPGHYRLSVNGGPGWYLESVTVGGQDALDFPFEVKAENLSGVNVTFTDKQTELTGSLVDDKGQPAVDYTLVIFPADQRYWGASGRRVRTVRPATDGRFTLMGLPPGEYKLATVTDLEPGAASDPAYLQSIDAATMRITLQPGEKKVQDIRLR